MNGAPLHVTVMMFAQLRELTGADQVALALPAGSRLSDVWPHLVRTFPRLEGMEPSLAWAVNHTYVKPDHSLNDGDMIAALPPSAAGPTLRVSAGMIDIVEHPIDLNALIEWARQDSDGAVVSFQGTVRDFAEGRDVTGMEYHCYRELALKELEALEAETRKRFPIGRIALIHRVGPMTLGDVSVAIVVASPHRAEAFDACRFAIDTLKQTIPIWKKEHFQNETQGWVRGVTGRSVDEASS